MDVIIMKVLLFCLLAAASALVCDTGYYLNTNLQVCLVCTNGCTACCDENLCSACDIGKCQPMQDMSCRNLRDSVMRVRLTASSATRH
jgi:hypothetical protein